MDNKSGENQEADFDDVTPDRANSSSDSEGRVWYWVVAALILGGFIGWAVGRQTAPALEKPADFVAADNQICHNCNSFADYRNLHSTERKSVALGPTPASIRPETDPHIRRSQRAGYDR